MKDNREHVSFEDLNDLVDGRLEDRAAARVSEHIATCAECRSEHDQLIELLAMAAGAQGAVDPGEDLWADVRRTIEARKEVALPVTAHASEGRLARRHIRVRPMLLAAAAVILIVLSSGITTFVLRKAPSQPVQIAGSTRPAGVMLPASFQATEDEYARTISELRIAVDAQRANLNPETVRTVDHSLAVVDTAIAEARAALIADPNNRTLVDLLASSYQRKLDLLRRTSELSSKI